MPDGHIWDVKSGMTFTLALESMATDGVKSFAAAEQRWRASNAPGKPTAANELNEGENA
jgi:hypothetical protein